MKDDQQFTALAFGASSTAMFWVRRDASLQQLNASACRMFGICGDSSSSRKLTDLVTQLPESWESIWQRALQERSIRFEVQIPTQAGDPASLEISADLIQQGGEDVLFALALDITERKTAVDALQRSELVQRSIMESSLDSILLLDPDETIHYINRTVPSLTREQVIGTSIRDHLTDEFYEQAHACFERVLATGQHDTYISNYEHEGITVTYESQVAPVMTGDSVTALTVVARDVTKQREAERVVRESEEKFRLLTEQSPAIVLIVSSSRIIYGNAMLVEATGYPMDEILLMDFCDLIHPECTGRPTIEQILEGRPTKSRCELQLRKKDGEPTWIDLSAQAMEFEGLPALLMTCIDITERIVAEQQLRETESQLAHVSRLSTMGEMVAGIAHEINQPLSSIANYALASHTAIQASGMTFAVPIGHWLKEVNIQAVRCGDIIRGLRDFVNKNDGGRECFDINEVVRESIPLMENTGQQPPVTFRCDLQDPGPEIFGNRVQLQQVLVNLLRNARDATVDLAGAEIVIRVTVDDGMARLMVEDNGSGVHESERQYLFDAFFTTKPDGMGMGLAISKSIIESHEGILRFEPRESEGSRFLIELPAA